MLRLPVKTKLEPLEALDRAKKYFEEKGLTLVENTFTVMDNASF